MKKQQRNIAVVAVSVMVLFAFVFLSGGINGFMNGNIQTFSLTNDFRQINCEMWNGLAVTRDSGLKVQVDTSTQRGFNPFFDTSLLSITDGTNTITELHVQLFLTCKGDFMDESDAVNVGGSVDALICGDPASGTTKCLVGDNRKFSGDLRNAQDFVTIDIPQVPLPNDKTTKIAEWTFTDEELELAFTADDGKIFFESKMAPFWQFTFNHPTKGVFTANYNSAQQNDIVVAQYGQLESTTTANSSETDFDGDGISDLADLCPTQPETVNGFQDSDGCPDVVDNSGTIDSDGDGIVDNDDACDFLPEDGLGLFPNDGCPNAEPTCQDSDNDGTCDTQDNCVFEAGFPQYNGCPTDINQPLAPTDSDGDGVFDENDHCPTQGGLVDANGCPTNDIDGDGIADNNDSCPFEGGIVDSTGCPILCGDNYTLNPSTKTCEPFDVDIGCVACTVDDLDGDGIPNDQDQCANTPEDFNGIADTDGCPESTSVEEPIIDNPVDVIRDVIEGKPLDESEQRTIAIILILIIGLLALLIIGRFIKKKRR